MHLDVMNDKYHKKFLTLILDRFGRMAENWVMKSSIFFHCLGTAILSTVCILTVLVSQGRFDN